MWMWYEQGARKERDWRLGAGDWGLGDEGRGHREFLDFHHSFPSLGYLCILLFNLVAAMPLCGLSVSA
jgi:hypothetical protein